MSERTISIGFTNEEYSKILELAQAKNYSISQYIRSKVIPNEFNIKYSYLIKKISKLKPDTIFTVKTLWRIDEWNEIPKGIKLSLGKHFYTNVKLGNFTNIKIIGYGKYGIMNYLKINY